MNNDQKIHEDMVKGAHEWLDDPKTCRQCLLHCMCAAVAHVTEAAAMLCPGELTGARLFDQAEGSAVFAYGVYRLMASRCSYYCEANTDG